jgi:hypothetical protein
MSAFLKKYPRALIKRHPKANGWTIDLIQRAGTKPKRVAATYASIPWAHRAACQKLGLKVEPTPPVEVKARPALPAPGDLPRPKDYGFCNTCRRPMRPAGSKVADYPGTTLRHREGLCQSCNKTARRAAR